MGSRADMGGYAFGKVVLTVTHSKGAEKPLVCAIMKESLFAVAMKMRSDRDRKLRQRATGELKKEA